MLVDSLNPHRYIRSVAATESNSRHLHRMLHVWSTLGAMSATGEYPLTFINRHTYESVVHHPRSNPVTMRGKRDLT